MDSEDDMHDARWGTSDDDDDRNDDDDFESDLVPSDDDDDDDDDEEESDYGFDDNDGDDLHPSYRRRQLAYIVLNEKDIEKRQEEAIENVAMVLSISKAQASMLLRHFEWCVSRVNDEWFANEQVVRNSVGLLEMRYFELRPDIRELKCGICLEYHPTEKMRFGACSHFFCNLCWTGYIHTAINDGPGCLALRCPNPECPAAVGEDLALSLVTEEDRTKYKRYALRSYVEDNRKVRWCPAPGCEYAVEFIPGSGSYDILCKCGHNFCWNCLEEAHRPVDCATVAQWILKNCAESENMNWILANSKPCPKCKRPIEKNQGCMHITCMPPCKYEFCWLCLGAWSEHGERTGGFYACNRYETDKKDGKYDEAEKRREMAKNSLERYTHYYERWATNKASREKAISDLQQMQAVHIEKLSDKQCQPVSQLKFVTEAWLQIIECRRVLKWTYAYGYYLPENEVAKGQFFEYLQGEAEAGLERLHKCAEKDLQVYLEVESPDSSFNDFRTKLAGLTSVTRNYFENLVRALENGLADVDSSKVSGHRSTSSQKAQVSSKGRAGRQRVGSSRSGGSSQPGDGNAHWYCEHCTYANTTSTSVCAMCHLANI